MDEGAARADRAPPAPVRALLSTAAAAEPVPERDAVAYDDMASLDKYILGRFSAVVAEVTDAFDNFQFFRASQALLRFASGDLSSFYLDIAKDRLYVSAPQDQRRRSCGAARCATVNRNRGNVSRR